MPITKSPQIGTAFEFASLFAFPMYVTQKPKVRKELPLSRIIPEQAAEEMICRFKDECEDMGIEAKPEELRELKMFHEFLTRHTKPNATCDVQRMLLWTEWVRFCGKKAKHFPGLVLEKEFDDLVTNKFDLKPKTDGFRGFVYPGVKYIP